MDKEILTRYPEGKKLIIDDGASLDKKLDEAIIEYMKLKKISTLDIIATEIKDDRNKVVIDIHKSNMRSKGEI